MTKQGLFPIKAFRIAHNLSCDLIAIEANISRSYLSRIEQGMKPGAEIAESLIRAMKSGRCVNPKRKYRQNDIYASKEILDQLPEPFSEIHILYPHRFVTTKG